MRLDRVIVGQHDALEIPLQRPFDGTALAANTTKKNAPHNCIGCLPSRPVEITADFRPFYSKAERPQSDRETDIGTPTEICV